MGAPSSSMNCFRLVPAVSADVRPMRVPSPAAGIMTATFIAIQLSFSVCQHHLWRRGGAVSAFAHYFRFALHGPLMLLDHHGVHAVVELPKDHFTRGGLQHAGDGDVDGLRDHALGVIDNYHSTVIQISHTLV